MDLRVAGEGNAGVAGGPPGDLIVGVEVEPSDAFERQGHDLFGVLDVSVTQATLGGEIEIETFEGPERLSIDAGTESGTVLRLRGKRCAASAAAGTRRPLRDRPRRHATRSLQGGALVARAARAAAGRTAASGNGTAPRALRRPEFRS